MLSSSSSPDEAVTLNNEATLLMKNGDYSQATVTLSSALVAMRTGIRNATFPVAASPSAFSNIYQPGFHFIPRHTASIPTGDLECGDWFLYEDAVAINSKHAFASEKSVEIVAYAIIYNLGLCHHLQAVDALIKASRGKHATTITASSSFSQSSLHRAVALYTQAQKLLVAHGLDNLQEMIHIMAITNNLGHAHHFLHNEPSAKICFERLLHAIMYISESGEQGQRVLMSHEPCFDGFLRNIMNLTGTSLAAPAA
jgi:hypothetical protein